MGIIANKSNIDTVIYNGTEIEKVVYNGVVIWEKAPAVYDYSDFGTFVGLYGTTHFLFRQKNSNMIDVVNISTFRNEGEFNQFDFKYGVINEFEAIKSGALYCNQYNGSYSVNELMQWTIKGICNANSSTPGTTKNPPLGRDIANTIELNYMEIAGLDFNTLYCDMYAINYATNKLVLNMHADYYVENNTGTDTWENSYTDVYIIEIPIINETGLDSNKSRIIKHFYSNYSIDEPSSYEDYDEAWYYNTYTQDLYEICSHEDNDGEIIEFFTINNKEVDKWCGLSAPQISNSNIIRNAEFSFKDIDATLSIPYATLNNNTLNVYVFNKNKLVKSTLTDNDLFATRTTSGLSVKYNGEDVYIANTTKKIIKKLKFNPSTFEVTL